MNQNRIPTSMFNLLRRIQIIVPAVIVLIRNSLTVYVGKKRFFFFRHAEKADFSLVLCRFFNDFIGNYVSGGHMNKGGAICIRFGAIGNITGDVIYLP